MKINCKIYEVTFEEDSENSKDHISVCSTKNLPTIHIAYLEREAKEARQKVYRVINENFVITGRSLAVLGVHLASGAKMASLYIHI